MPTATSSRELTLFRNAHAGAARRAAHIWELVCELKSCTVVIPSKTALTFLANSIYYNGRYDASERYESAEEFEVDLAEDFSRAFPERVTLVGVESVVLRPFFNASWDYLLDLGMSYLRGCDTAEIEILNAKVIEVSATLPEGLTDDEHDVLTVYHRSACLKFINAMRHLHTTLKYISEGLASVAENKYKKCPEHVMDPRAAGLVAELVAAVDLPYLPVPCGHFSSDSNRLNTLTKLDADEKTLAPLLCWT